MAYRIVVVYLLVLLIHAEFRFGVVESLCKIVETYLSCFLKEHDCFSVRDSSFQKCDWKRRHLLNLGANKELLAPNPIKLG